MDAGIRPAFFPAVEIGLGPFQAFEAETSERGLLSVCDSGLDLSLPIWISDTTREGDRTVVSQDVAVERIELGVVDIRLEDAFAQVVAYSGDGDRWFRGR